MIQLLKRPAAKSGRKAKRDFVIDALEPRVVLSGAHVHAEAVLGTITGQVLNSSTEKGVRNVTIHLFNADGGKVATTSTNNAGRYTFRIKTPGPYVVHEVTPRRTVQVTPTFATIAPTGAYTPGAGSNSWNYTTSNDNPANGAVGPHSWDTIAPAGNLPFESPIDLKGPTTDLSQYISVNYANAAPSAIINNSHQIQVQFSTAASTDSVTLAGTPFKLAQFHFHDPAENYVNGHVYQLEEHFVNTSSTGATSVVGVFFQLGAHNGALDPILNAATANLTKPNSTTTLSTAINFAGLMPTNTQGWFFQGSLTTPPLAQPVNWFVYSTPITLDYAQLKQYETLASGSGFLPNARPLQPLDGRTLNQIDADINFTGSSVAGVNFSVAPKA